MVGWRALALVLMSVIAQAAYPRSADDDMGDPAAFVGRGRGFPGGLFRRQQPAPPAARVGRGAEGQDRGDVDVSVDNGVESRGFTPGSWPEAGFVLPTYGLTSVMPAARVGTGAPPLIFSGNFGSHHNDLMPCRGVPAKLARAYTTTTWEIGGKGVPAGLAVILSTSWAV